jgi:signal peptidase II
VWDSPSRLWHGGIHFAEAHDPTESAQREIKIYYDVRPISRMTNHSARLIHFLIAVIVFLLDRWTKHLVAARIGLYSHVQVIPGFLRITHTENTGAAFSLFADSPSHWKTSLLVGFSAIAIVIIVALLWKQSRPLGITGVALSLILGGAAGNLWDRVISGRVVDFLLVYHKSYQWPVFNLADSAIVVGAALMVIDIIFAKAPTEGQTA